MERKEFLKRLGMSSLIVPLLHACSSDDDEATNVGDCTSTSSETAGPFPTKDPSSLELVDIRSDRTGVPFTIKIIIQNKNNDCAPLADAIVDIWHCDKDGYYSEYGGTTMQTVNFTAVHFLRGRQTTDSNGLVGFTSIFPGWYPSRAPHIHVHIYNASGTSLLVTQIAFPADVTDTVYTTATQYYTKGKQDTSNAADSIFSDSIANELATVTGNVTDGYVLTHTIVVNA
ncbi:dioxygenase family protein [Ohtaekwangia koreensis]|uniref:Dioxygenase n=1 Tax=Ohtaekwangia koreensis TaxID=688867 RepID=A0A1T5MCG6_9BACT|nr:intradiol ring-cleavage dioxygenase [Ohtaekwangia koreensis]SKC85937.1 Dioxygenase [Ohtaekwangia koreensis]